MLYWYIDNIITRSLALNKKHKPGPEKKIVIERTQTGVRIEKRMLKVLKALAEYYDLSLGDLLEGIILHSFEANLLLAQTRKIASKKSNRFTI